MSLPCTFNTVINVLQGSNDINKLKRLKTNQLTSIEETCKFLLEHGAESEHITLATTVLEKIDLIVNQRWRI